MAKAIVGVAVILAGRVKARGGANKRLRWFIRLALATLLPGGLAGRCSLLRVLVFLVCFVMADRATTGRAHCAVLTRNVAGHAANGRTFQTSLGVDRAGGEEHRGCDGDGEKFVIHEQVPFLVDAPDFMPALTLETASAVPVDWLAVFARICSSNAANPAHKKTRSVETERAF
jgi:hypothetical protein